MKTRKILIVFACTLVGCAVLSNGQLLYKQYSPINWPYSYDPNMVIGKILGGIELAYGNKWTCAIEYADPDGDPITVTLTGIPNVQAIGAGKLWQWQWTPALGDIGMHYLVTTIQDVPALGDPNNPWGQPLTDQGTIFVIVRKPNANPILALLKDLVAKK